MEPTFWQARWAERQIGFHRADVHPTLVENAAWFLDDAPHRILVPLCGKSVDVAFLASRGHEVVGIELVEDAVTELFSDAGLTPEWSDVPGGRRARSGPITILQGDLFAFPDDVVGRVDRVWDRAAMVALHPDQRSAYVERIRRWLRGSLLLDVLVYDPAVMDGPPWSIDEETVRRWYPEATPRRDVDGLDDRFRVRGHTWFREVAWRADLG